MRKEEQNRTQRDSLIEMGIGENNFTCEILQQNGTTPKNGSLS
jgi:hypothetical protein